MRWRLPQFLPIVLIALAVQIFAPIAACCAVGIAASDPLSGAVICHDSRASGQTDRTGQGSAHDGCCSVCSVAHIGAPLDTPQVAVTIPYSDPARVAWADSAPALAGARTGCHAQARAPPTLT
jgi:hypothetical protein